nr:Gfo/Idh/MocA family oxidoreductase [bacterium]
MAVKTVRVGIIGCGGIANGKHMPSLAQIEGVEMVAFCDLIPERAEKAKAEYGTPDAQVFTDYKELLKLDLDSVHVCCPNVCHAPITIDALHAGKHVMCEKPMATTYAEAKAMCEAAKETGKSLTIGYQSRYRADSQYLKKLIDEGELGEIYYAKAPAIRRRGVPTWGVFLDEEKQGGGPLIDIGTHALDLTLWMMNNYEPQMVVGSVYRKLADTENAANDFGPWDPKKFTVEDSAFGFIKFKNGATVVLEASWALNIVDTIEAKTLLCGTKAGADMIKELRINGEKNSRLYVTYPNMKTGGVAFYEGTGNDDPSVAEARTFVEHIRTGSPLTVLPEQAAVVSQILEAIYISGKENRPVFFD